MTSKASVISCKGLTYTYPGATGPALNGIDLEVETGEIVLITGPTGAGKTTLCSTFNGLVPHFYGGRLSGQVNVLGRDVKETSAGYLSTKVGMLFQDPSSQLISATVEDEVAFGPENLGTPVEEIAQRTNSVLDFMGLNALRDRPPFALSGGQQQAVGLAAVIAMKPEILVLDEPTSNLDPIGTMNIFSLLRRISREEESTIIIVEHKLQELVDIADRIVVIDEGKIQLEGAPREILAEDAVLLYQRGLQPPQVSLLAHRLKEAGIPIERIPLTISEAVEAFSSSLRNLKETATEPEREKHESRPRTNSPIIELKNVSFRYPSGVLAVQDVSVNFYQEDFVGIIGQNGSGKTTLVKLLNGLLRPTQGVVTVFGLDARASPIHELIKHVGYVFQDPDSQLFSRTVSSELTFGLKNLKIPKNQWDSKIRSVAKILHIDSFMNEAPFSLSRADRQRVSIASVLVMDPQVIVVDEPTTGQDPRKRREIMELMKELHDEHGKTVIFITHDMDLVAEYAKRSIVMKSGKIILDGDPHDVFLHYDELEGTNLKPPMINSLFKELAERYPIRKDILTVDEAFEYLRSKLVN